MATSPKPHPPGAPARRGVRGRLTARAEKEVEMTAQERLERLEVELGRARRWNRWLLLLVGLTVGACLVVGGLAGRKTSAQADQSEVRTKCLMLQDDNGKTRAKLAMGKEGPRLALYDENGKVRAGLGAGKDGPVLALYDENGKGRASMTVLNQEPGLVLWGEKGEVLWQAP